MTTPAPYLVPLHYLTPSILLIPLILVLLPKPAPIEALPGIRPITVQKITPRRSLISTSLVLLSFTAFADIIIFTVDLLTANSRNDDVIPDHLKGAQLASQIIYTLGGLVIYGSALSGVWWRDKWQGSGLVLLATLGFGLEVPNLVGLVIREIHTGGYDKIFTILALIPSSLRLLILPVLLIAVLSPRITFEAADERTGLLSDSPIDGRMDGPPSASEYGTFDSESQNQTAATTNAPGTPVPGQNGAVTTTDNNATKAATDAKKIKITKKLGEKKEEKKDLTFKEAWPKFKSLVPKLWPSTDMKLQFFVVMTGVMIAFDRVLTPLSPIAMGFLVRALTERNQHDIWKWLGTYLVLRLLNSYGIITTIQQAFWMPVVYYTDREMQMLCFDHLLNLSLAYHTKRNTGEVMRILDKGSAINELFRTVLFSVIPTFADIVIGFSVFMWLFGPLLTGSVLLIMIPYIVFTYYSTKFRKTIRKQYIEMDVKQRGIVSDVLTNWENVKYFTAEKREIERYQEAVTKVQEINYKWTMGYQAIYAIQSVMLTLGFAVGAIIIAYNVMRGIGDSALFVIFVQYYSSFTSPLNQLSNLYRSISTDITDSEKMLNLLGEKTEIKDEPDATDLVITDGVIEFENVSFSYDGKVEALKNVSFKLGKGESMALVGETGSGKSTILRLLYRFYNVTEGRILIDGQDISKVKQQSLRHAIGIVPQDSVLWNDTIGANIAYGRPDATDEEIIQAAISGKMHEKIMNFDEGYDTVVGERGVRLSGGEKQRVSLSRMFLKSPAILVLDEATSALDTETEREIQKSLAALAKGRSSLSIAHRLSTIINSDKIVVMKNGEIVEIGGYKDLVSRNGAFAKMWKRQIYTEAELLEDDDVEKVATTLSNADRFRRAHEGQAKDSDDDEDGNAEKPVLSEGSTSTVTNSNGKEKEKEEEYPALIDLTHDHDDKKEDKPVAGFAVDAPAPIIEDSSNPSFAEAVKSPSGTAAAPATPAEVNDQAPSAQQPGADNQVNTGTTTPEVTELNSAATGPSSVVEAQDPLASAVITDVQVADEPAPAPVAEELKVSPQPQTVEDIPSVPFPASPSVRKESVATSASPSQSVDQSPTKSFPSSPGIPFPSSSTSKPANTKRWSTMSASPSVASALSSQGDGSTPPLGSSPSKSETPSGDKDKDKGDKRRKRLSSIKGFVRRFSDQNGLTRSNSSGLKSPLSEDSPSIPSDHVNNVDANEQTPLIGTSPQRERRVSTHASGEDAKKVNKKKKNNGKH
ncbi:uncharacterized protein I303_102737 [Kwoniella dejecticola CBS 10117]|uniref:ABC transporter n=1 Tax=Kwoniella dejecticola CBS 10117 TaxID=1296121 RepID=A0A1A6A9K8_9TREE|nr:uncharacterized protein I303_02752 [Kwoniella dejecticola CBS 10117]OBR86738.1 hypothetical protein I303_02752 [Kwoniella dejecticola CBS 10117]